MALWNMKCNLRYQVFVGDKSKWIFQVILIWNLSLVHFYPRSVFLWSNWGLRRSVDIFRSFMHRKIHYLLMGEGVNQIKDNCIIFSFRRKWKFCQNKKLQRRPIKMRALILYLVNRWIVFSLFLHKEAKRIWNCPWK